MISKIIYLLEAMKGHRELQVAEPRYTELGPTCQPVTIQGFDYMLGEVLPSVCQSSK